MFCQKCGNQLNEGAAFCSKCGTKTNAATGIGEQGRDENSSNTINSTNNNALNNSLYAAPVVANKEIKKNHKGLKIAGQIFAVFAVCFVVFAAWNLLRPEDDTANNEISENGKVYSNDVQTATNTSEESASESVPSNTGVQPYGDGTTILVYIVGSNLESDSGCATADIDEMMNAEFGEDIHLIVQTGGANAWQSSSVDGASIDNRYIQRYRVRSGEKELIESLELTNMGSAQTLSDFLKWGVDTYPAERYIAILWDHGGGTVGNYGVDEIYNSAMSIYDVKTAFANSGYHFDMIGFDACLMATFENAYALSDCADYLLASEELEWGDGWYYTDWLTALGNDPNMSTEEIGRKVIDDYARTIDTFNRMYDTNTIYTLSLVDLTKIDELYMAITDCFDEANSRIAAGGFNELSYARSEAAFYGGGSDRAPQGVLGQIDIMDFLTKADLLTDSSSDIICGENGFVVYEKNNYYGSNGIAMYFPYTLAFNDYYGSYDNAAKLLKDIGYEDSYFKFFDSFVGVLADINDFDFTPQYGGDSAENDIQAAISNNPSTDPVLDEQGWLPIVKDENGYYMIDLSVQPEEFVNNITSIWSYTYVDTGEYTFNIMTTPDTKEVGFGNTNYISYGGLSLRPYPYAHLINGQFTSVYYLCDGPVGGSYPQTYYEIAKVNGEDTAIILDSRITMIPTATGGVVPGSKAWSIRGYTTSFNEGIPEIRDLRDFKIGDTICSQIETSEGEILVDLEEYTIGSEDYLYGFWNYGAWSLTYPSFVMNVVTDTFGRTYATAAFYPSSDGRYSDFYYKYPYSTQHEIEGN